MLGRLEDVIVRLGSVRRILDSLEGKPDVRLLLSLVTNILDELLRELKDIRKELALQGDRLQ